MLTVYKRADGKRNTDSYMSAADIARHSGVGYNPAVEARYVTPDQADFVRSKKVRYHYTSGDTIDLIEERSPRL